MKVAKAKLIQTDSCFGLFDCLLEQLDGAARGAEGKNLIFCEEKISLMAERRIARHAGASINTAVYSFGNYLRVRRKTDNLLTKEGSAMVIKKIIAGGALNCFNASKAGLAPSLYELIMQLKSAAVDPETVERAGHSTQGILSNKLTDVAWVFSQYERYLAERGLKDQSSVLGDLPNILESDAEITGANVYIFGFTGFTAQIRNIIRVLLRRAESVTAILTGGKNGFVYVNETAEQFCRLARQVGASLVVQERASDYSKEGRIIANGLFDPAAFSRSKTVTDRVAFFAADNRANEIRKAAGIIKQSVMRGECRYRDFTIICPEKQAYRRDIKEIFGMLEIPYFFDEKKKPRSHPLITLILSYTEIFRKGYSVQTLSEFFKNPIICADRDFSDRFENYLIKYNVEYGAFRRPLLFAADTEEQTREFESFREKICQYLARFDVEKMLKDCGAEDAVAAFTERLKSLGEAEEAAVNEQIFSAVKSLLSEIKSILGEEEISYTEYKQIFTSGVAAMELSIIPQYNDAVFIGGFKETALVKTKRLFAVGLSSGVPQVKEDVALLSDGDINALSEIKVLVEPKISIVNHRAREETALGLSAFSERLYLSYPMYSGGKKNVRSEVLSYLDALLTFTPFPKSWDYLTVKQGLNTFARQAGRFAEGVTDDFVLPASFYFAEGGDCSLKIAQYAGKEIKERLDGFGKILLKDVTSPTAIEDFYKCPYRSFLQHGLMAGERKAGELGGLSVGILMHEVFYEFISRVQNGDNTVSIAEQDALFDQVVSQVLAKDEYKKFTQSAQLKSGLEDAVAECRKFCFITVEWLRNSRFKTSRANLEAKFGDGKDCAYPAVSLLSGKVKLSGKIDRVDTFGDYFRVIDYKTGTADDSDKGLFSGTKLQLYLYAAAVASVGKKPAGAYYMKVSDPYCEKDKTEQALMGKTLDDLQILAAQDCKIFDRESPYLPVSITDKKVKGVVSERTMAAFTDYAIKVSERAVARLSEGVIVASPYDGACEYCPYVGVCAVPEQLSRTIKTVTDDVIEQAGSAPEGEQNART